MKWHKIIGVILILFNIWIIFMYTRLFYQYHYTEILFFYKSPNWVLFSFILIGTIGVLIGYKVFNMKWTIKKGVLADLALILVAVLIGQMTNL